MTTPLWCLLLVAIAPYLIAGIGGYLRLRQLGELDNHDPRKQAERLEGAAARAVAAQQNAWEALALFAPAVIVNHVLGGAPGASATAAGVFVAARVGHLVCYLADWATARSAVFLVGLASALWLFGLAVRAPGVAE